jgi:hypothetical protein
MGQASAIVIAQWRDKHLGFMLEPAERLGMQNTIPVALETSSHVRFLFGPIACRAIAERRQRRKPGALIRFEPLADARVGSIRHTASS